MGSRPNWGAGLRALGQDLNQINQQREYDRRLAEQRQNQASMLAEQRQYEDNVYRQRLADQNQTWMDRKAFDIEQNTLADLYAPGPDYIDPVQVPFQPAAGEVGPPSPQLSPSEMILSDMQQYGPVTVEQAQKIASQNRPQAAPQMSPYQQEMLNIAKAREARLANPPAPTMSPAQILANDMKMRDQADQYAGGLLTSFRDAQYKGGAVPIVDKYGAVGQNETNMLTDAGKARLQEMARDSYYATSPGEMPRYSDVLNSVNPSDIRLDFAEEMAFGKDMAGKLSKGELNDNNTPDDPTDDYIKTGDSWFFGVDKWLPGVDKKVPVTEVVDKVKGLAKSGSIGMAAASALLEKYGLDVPLYNNMVGEMAAQQKQSQADNRSLAERAAAAALGAGGNIDENQWR